MTTCPVCGVNIEEETLVPDEGYGSEGYAKAQTEYDGDVYEFCCSEHREEFESNPEKYA